MNNLNAGLVLLVVLGGLVVLAGFPGGCPGGTCGEDVYSYSVDVEMVENPPDNETVLNETDPRLDDVTILNESIAEEATEQPVIMSINETRYNELSQKFADLPLSQNVSQEGHNLKTILVRYNGTVYEVRLEKVGRG